ncbi:MAG: Do family serine endopeptidase [Planctomycetaceae bacterium]
MQTYVRNSATAWLVAGLLSIGTAIGLLASVSSAGHSAVPETVASIHWNNGLDDQPSALNSPRIRGNAESLSHAFRDASAQVIPAVVTIESFSETAATRETGQLPEELRNHPYFKRYFDSTPYGGSGEPRPRTQPGRHGSGSGVIVDKSGIILTNNHVVDGATSLVVRLHDGRELTATQWRTDPKSDIAIVSVASEADLPTAAIGDSDALQVGDWVIAVGAPFGLNETVTAGIISAKSRGLGITDREEFLQTDAAINPGNSGGPLVNLRGQVVGINTAISSTSGGYQGVGFAIPVNLARWVSDQLIATGSVQRAFLGVTIQPVTAELSEQFHLDHVSGVVVTNVGHTTPAANAGLRTGDVILEFDGKAIHTPQELQGAVEQAGVGETHNVVIIRDGSRQSLAVHLSQMPAEVTTRLGGLPDTGSTARFGTLGLQVANLTPDVAAQLQLEGIDGVVVTGVQPGSPADLAGIAEAMAISQVGRTRVASVDEFRKAMEGVSLGDGVLLLVHNGGRSRFVVVRSKP